MYTIWDMEFTHLDARGQARMVDVTAKEPTVRSATAVATVKTSPEVVEALRTGTVPKGDVLAVARVAGIAAAKKTPELLPLAHIIGVHGCTVDLEIADDGVDITATVRTADRTGVEMEALTSVTVAALAIVDMVKGVDRSAEIVSAKITAKSGGRSGDWTRGPAGATLRDQSVVCAVELVDQVGQQRGDDLHGVAHAARRAGGVDDHGPAGVVEGEDPGDASAQ